MDQTRKGVHCMQVHAVHMPLHGMLQEHEEQQVWITAVSSNFQPDKHVRMFN